MTYTYVRRHISLDGRVVEDAVSYRQTGDLAHVRKEVALRMQRIMDVYCDTLSPVLRAILELNVDTLLPGEPISWPGSDGAVWQLEIVEVGDG